MAIRMDLPFALPEGTVRGAITISLTVGAVIMLLTSKSLPEWYLAILSTTLAYYFVSRKSNGNGNGNGTQ